MERVGTEETTTLEEERSVVGATESSPMLVGVIGKDGEGERAGRGQGNGLDVSTFSFRYFSLTPGAGGEHVTGGGGGGLLVNHLGQGEGCGGET